MCNSLIDYRAKPHTLCLLYWFYIACCQIDIQGLKKQLSQQSKTKTKQPHTPSNASSSLLKSWQPIPWWHQHYNVIVAFIIIHFPFISCHFCILMHLSWPFILYYEFTVLQNWKQFSDSLWTKATLQAMQPITCLHTEPMDIASCLISHACNKINMLLFTSPSLTSDYALMMAHKS